MAVHDIRYYLNGILFVAEGKTLTLVATDGHRLALAQATLDVEMPKQEVILPRKTVLELQRLLKDKDKNDENPAAIEMRFSGNQAVRVQRHGVRHQAGRGQVPRLQPRHPEEPQAPAGAGPRPAAGQPAARRHPDQREVQGRAPDLPRHQLTIAASNAEQEEAKEELEIDYDGDKIEIGFNVTYLTDVLANMPQEMVASSALFSIPERSDFKYVVMPMRI
jgi:DNA polymerase-3 subunit beta